MALSIEFTICYGDCYLVPHDLAFHVRVGIIFPCIIMVVPAYRFVRGKLFQPLIVTTSSGSA